MVKGAVVSMISAVELMEMQAATLFTHDQRGRLLRVNDPDGADAPRFFLGRTRVGNVWRFRHDLPPEVVQALLALCVAEPPATDFRAAPAGLEGFRTALQSHAPIRRQWAGPAYRFPDRIECRRSTERITEERADLLQPGFVDWIPWLGCCQPCVVMMDDGMAVSLCCSVRISSRAHEAGVETLEDYRGRGYAADVAAAWALAVRELGCIPLYSTSWESGASQRVAAKLGLIAYGADLHLA